MRRPLSLLIASILLVLIISPVAAAPTRVDTLPAPAPFTSARFDFALVAFGEALGYGKGEVESATRLHLALRTPPMGDQPEQTIEIILYDGTIYSRENESTQWYIEGTSPAEGLPTGGPPSDVASELPEDVPITLIGDRDVAGVPTSQYQLWMSAQDGSFSTADFFLGKQVAYLHKMQISSYSDIEDQVPLIGLDFHFYDFDDPGIKVSPPAQATPRPGIMPVSRTMSSLRYSADGLSNAIQVLRALAGRNR